MFASPLSVSEVTVKPLKASFSSDWLRYKTNVSVPVRPRRAPEKFSGALSGLAVNSTRGLERLFRATTEYIWELMLIDVAALWLPRIYNSLVRGRIETKLHHVQNDERYKNYSEKQQKWVRFRKNVAGLNWPNAIEETWREIQSAPMILVAQSLFYDTLMQSDVTKKAILVSRKELKPLVSEFQDFSKRYFSPTMPTKKLSPEQFKRFYAQFVHGFLEPNFSQLAQKPIELKYLRENASEVATSWLNYQNVKNVKNTPGQVFEQWLASRFGETAAKKAPGYQALTKLWAQDWSHAIVSRASHKELKRLETVLTVMNEAYREQVVKRIPHTALDDFYAKGLGKITPAHFTETMEKFSDFIRASFAQALKAPQKNQPLAEGLSRAAKLLEPALTVRKAAYSVGIFTICTILYFASSIHSQSHNIYPANRLLAKKNPEEEAKKLGALKDKKLGNRLSLLVQDEAKR